MFTHLFGHHPEGPPEHPEEEYPDPNVERALPDSVRNARRILVAVCALGCAWSLSLFNVQSFTVEALGVQLDLKQSTVPFMLELAVLYFTARWLIEFAMLPRRVRRWPMAQLDARLTLWIARAALVIVAAGAMDRDLRAIAIVVATLTAAALAIPLLEFLLGLVVFMPIRGFARKRAGARVGSAWHVAGSLVWGQVCSIITVPLAVVGLGVFSFVDETFGRRIWATPPQPLELTLFTATVAVTIASPWLLRPVIVRLFAVRPDYSTSRTESGEVHYQFFEREKEPLL